MPSSRILCLAVLLLLGASVKDAWGEEKQFFGKSRKTWTKELQSSSVTERRFAALALGHMGLEARGSLEEIKAACLDKDALTRKAALRALSLVSPRDDKTLLILLKALDDKDPAIVDSAIRAVARYARVHPKMFPNLLIRKDTEDLERRRRVYRALGLLHSQRYDVIPKLIESLADPDPAIRKIILESIVDLDPDSLSIVRALMIMLRDPDRRVRETSMRQIARLGPKAVAAIPWLMKILKNQKFSEYREASLTLGAIGEGAFQEVLKLSKDGDADLKARGIRALGAFGDRGVKELTLYLQHPDPRIRAMAVTGFTSHSKLSPKALESLVEVFKNTENEDIQSQVLKILKFAGANGVDPLMTLLGDANTVPLKDVIKSLAWIGAPSQKAFSKIKALSKDPKLKSVVEESLAKIGSSKAEELPTLMKLYNNPELRPQVILSLGKMGKAGAGSVPRLREQLQMTKPDLRKLAVKALGGLGPVARAAIPDLIKLAKDEPRLAQTCFEALVKIGSKQLGKGSAQTLRSFFKHKDETLRLAAIIALIALKDDAVPVFELKALLDSEKPRVAFVAARSLTRLGQHSPRVLQMLEDSLSKPIFRHSALKCLRYLGPKADPCIPKIADLLEQENVALTSAILDLIPTLSDKSELLVPFLRSAVQSDSLALKIKTIERLGSMGPRAKQALPVLIEALPDKDCQDILFKALKQIGLDPILSTPALIPLLDNKDLKLAAFARKKLYGFGPQTLPALLRTIDGLGVRNGLRAQALKVCAELPQKDLEAALPQFMNALFYVGAKFREAMALVLRKIGVKAVKPLTQQFGGGYWRRRQNAAYCLGELGALAKDAAPVLIEATKDKEGGVRLEALKALGKIGPSIAPELLKEMKAQPSTSHRNFLRLFATWKGRSKPHLPELLTLIQPKAHSETVLGVLRCLSAVSGEKQAYVPTLKKIFEWDRSETKLGALDFIYQWSLNDPRLLPDIEAQLGSNDFSIQSRAVEILGNFGKAAIKHGPLFVKGFQSSDKRYRKACATALSRLGSRHESIAKLVAAALSSENWLVRAYAAKCLGGMGDNAFLALDALKNCVGDKDARVRWATVKALGELGEGAVKALPQLTTALLDEDEDVVLAAIVTLGKIGVKARKAAPTLRKIKKIANKEQLDAIEKTLKSMEVH